MYYVHLFYLFMNREHGEIVNVSSLSKREDRILHSALEQLKTVYPAMSVTSVKLEQTPQSVFDGEITLKTDKATFKYLLEIKTNPRPEAISHIIVKKETDPRARNKPLLLVADYINPNLAARLKFAEINYVDAAGNLFLKGEPGHFLYIEGKKPVRLAGRLKTRLFQPSGLTLLFGLLLDPQAVNKPYRLLARDNGVALGTVGWVMRDLKEHGYLEPSAKKKSRLVRRKDLLDQWVQGYAQTLRPKILLGRFGNLAPHLQDVIAAFETHETERHIQWALTGGFGADELIHHYRGNMLTIYVSTWTPANVRELPLVPLEGGEITILRAFSPLVFATFQGETEHPVAHPLLIYAELLYQGTDRELETARLLYKEFLETSIGSS